MISMMRNLFFTLFFIAILCAGCHSEDNNEEPQDNSPITLYDKNKEAIAYIDYEDESVIYMFEGEPVAYIEPKGQVYGFNGKLLGWYSDGVLYDKTCHAVGAKHGIARGGINTIVTRVESVKGIKQVKPIKSVKENNFAPPVLFDSWSETPLTEFLASGKK